MSEVKRLQRYSRDFSGNLSKDPNGDWILFGDAAEREGFLAGKIAAQRLRADTAEADLQALRLVFENAEDCELNDAEQKLARVTAERDALQKRLNAADQKDDDLSFQLKDREGSRRDWFEEAQRLEKENKDLRKTLPNSTVELVSLRTQLAERDALLRECASEFNTAEASAFEVEMRRKIEAALSASAEPSAKVEAVAKEIYESWASQPGFTPWVDGGNSLKQDEARKAAQVQLSAPVERDERGPEE
ncbi:hypothetical protein ACRZ5O_22740 [Pseudomonas protegens]|uniref:hypothetical protein n=1 Tax=Pseudomonas protegens TaxID=380021 RepID=UPI003FD70875